ncbi:ComF family protein [Idiomarina seosinensis]|uniref:ComF family protein n=1 Tax=Idiomarina seosinensis TaxID=281739 RepID=UPI00384E4385
MLARLRRLANASGANSCLLCKLYYVGEVGICDYCAAHLPRWFPRCCQHLSNQGCAKSPAAQYWFACLRWTALTQGLIYRYKESGQWDLVLPFSYWLAAHLLRCYDYHQQALPDVVIAMPMTERRWRQRGFHHTGQLAQQVSHLLKLRYQPAALRLLRETPRQKQQSRNQRWQATKNSQYCRYDFSQLRVAVLDDVISSGATMSAAVAALRKGGASQIHCWALIYNQGD